MKDDHGSTHGNNKWQEGGFQVILFKINSKQTKAILQHLFSSRILATNCQK
jgi:hypothetical protein